MANNLILGIDGFKRLAQGYEVNANQVKTKAFTVAASATEGVVPGTLLQTTGIAGEYAPVTAALAAGKYIAGIALATNVKVDPMFPQSDSEVVFNAGDQAAALIYGEVAVKLNGSAPVEGAPVYWDFTNKAFTATSTDNVAVPGARFTGRNENGLAVVFVQYL